MKPLLARLRRVRHVAITTILATATALGAQACSDDEASSSDPAASCDSMCKGTGFTSSRLDAQPNETNCFCTGAGTVTAAACTEMCKATGKPGKPFRSSGATDNACQCQ